MSKFKYIGKRLLAFAAVSGAGALVVLETIPKLNEKRRNKDIASRPEPSKETLNRFNAPFPSREEQLKRMSSGEIFDVLVIGGGATGVGVAVDSATRGLSTCLVEKLDFASGTSSRSTKLIHGGVRYLQKAIFNLDIEQFRMVNEALAERSNLIDIAPHLACPLPILLPVYKWWQLPYFWAGIKVYDLISGKQILKASYYLNKSQVLDRFPLLNRDKLVGGLVYYDGQQEDARMCLSLALTAIRYDAAVINYVEVLDLIKDKQSSNEAEPVCGARVRDRMTGKEFVIKAKCVINATGPLTDRIRKLDNQTVQSICQPSSGVHIILPGYYCPVDMGLLDPSTSDGRVIFFLPWMNYSLAGTTDTECPVTDQPAPSEAEVNFILKEISNYLSNEIQVRRGDVLSAWAGIRPLVRDLNSKNTESIARNYVIEVSPSKLITIAGGKWTTYRHMAEETVNKAIEVCNLKAKNNCSTKGLLLEGAHGWSPNLFIRLVQEYGLEVDVARHLTNCYGDKAVAVANIARSSGMRWPIMGKKLHPQFPFIEAEVRYACQEYACHAVDFIARRTRLAFLNAIAAQESLPRVVDIMAEELGWSNSQKAEELKMAQDFLSVEMGLNLRGFKTSHCNLTLAERDDLLKQFHKMDSENKGYIALDDLSRFCKETGISISKDALKNTIDLMDVNKNGQVDVVEFLHFVSAIKSGGESNNVLKDMLTPSKIPVYRSGGGV